MLERSKENSSASVSNGLGINHGDPVIHLKRLRFIDKKPLIIVDQYLPFARFSKLLEINKESFSADLYSLLYKYYKLEIVKAEREVMAVRMSLMDAPLLQVELWEPCLRMKGIAYDSEGQAVDYFDARFSGTN